MRLVSQGIDLIECHRVAQIVERHGQRFVRRILTPAEEAYCTGHRNPIPRIAGRFAAKEAILKMLGTGRRGKIAWTDIEITNDAAGRPQVRLSGETARIASQQSIRRVLVSITHTPQYAAASAIGLAEP